MFTKQEKDAINSMRDRGYAIAVFTEEELNGADPSQVEDIMVERGWYAIDDLGGLEDED